MATVSFHPPGRGSQWTASSKSFASAPSMVTRGRSRRSVRSPTGPAISRGSRSASSSASSGQTWGIPWDRIAISAAMPGRSGSPRRSTMRPIRSLFQPSPTRGSASSTTTISPSFPSPFGIATSWGRFRWSGDTKDMPPARKKRPTTTRWLRSMTSSTTPRYPGPCRPPPRRETRTSQATRSPCMRPRISRAGRNRSSPPSSRARNPYPSRWAITRPSTTSRAYTEHPPAGRSGGGLLPARNVEREPARARAGKSKFGAQWLLVIRGALPYIAAPSAGRGGGTGRRASFRC